MYYELIDMEFKAVWEWGSRSNLDSRSMDLSF